MLAGYCQYRGSTHSLGCNRRSLALFVLGINVEMIPHLKRKNKMLCPTCSSRAIALIVWPGKLPLQNGQPNLLALYRCEQGHSFQTVAVYDGTNYQEGYTHSSPI